MLAELKKRLFYWKENKSRLKNFSAGQLRHIIAESDHISAAVDSTQGLLQTRRHGEADRAPSNVEKN